MPKEMPNFENQKESEIVRRFREAMEQENKAMEQEKIKEEMRDRILLIIEDEKFLHFRDKYIKELIENYAKLGPDAKKEADSVVASYIEMIEEYEAINKKPEKRGKIKK